MRSRRDTYSTATPLTLLLIPGTPSITSSTTTAPISTENIGVYLTITIFTHVDIIYKQITKIVKDI